MLKNYGTDAQKEKYLAPLATSKLGSFCLSEAGSGSDAFALQAKAVKNGNKWVLNGSKMYVLRNSFLMRLLGGLPTLMRLKPF
jgi:alkylation response protein AidB-like acyl-CoA dehydrogenase